jgi:hypothetical protein
LVHRTYQPISVSLRNRYWQRREEGGLGTPVEDALA